MDVGRTRSDTCLLALSKELKFEKFWYVETGQFSTVLVFSTSGNFNRVAPTSTEYADVSVVCETPVIAETNSRKLLFHFGPGIRTRFSFVGLGSLSLPFKASRPNPKHAISLL